MENTEETRVLIVTPNNRRQSHPGDETAALAGGAYVLGLCGLVIGAINMFGRWSLGDQIDTNAHNIAKMDARMDRINNRVESNTRSIAEVQADLMEWRSHKDRVDTKLTHLKQRVDRMNMFVDEMRRKGGRNEHE